MRPRRPISCVTPERLFLCPCPILPSPPSVRQNLLSLQATADLLATTQGRLATGKKVNSALDNPTNFFTAPASIPAPATSATCSTASATACRSCRPPTPASPRCPSWSIPPSRSPTRCCRRPSGYSTKSTRYQRRSRSAARRPTWLGTGARDQGRRPDHRSHRRRHGIEQSLRTGAGRQSTTLTSSTRLWRRNNLTASLDDATGELIITTTNDAASLPPARSVVRDWRRRQGVSCARFGSRCRARSPTRCRRRRARRWSAQYNQIITQITTTAQDASFNGINLLNGDSLKLVFDETGKSTLDDHRRDLQSDRSRPGCAHRRHRLPRQRCDQHRSDERSTPPASRCVRRRRPSVPTCRSCRSARTSTRT